MTKKELEPSVVLVGAGSLARALAQLLPHTGYRIREIVVRSGSGSWKDAEKLAVSNGARLATFETASWNAGIVWVAVSDGGIASQAELMAGLRGWKGQVVLHSSGVLSSKELHPLRLRGASVASVHPMMTFVPGKVPSMEGVAWTIEGDSRATSVARKLVRTLKGVPLSIKVENKPLYHAFAALLSPLLVVHLETAAGLAVAAGIPQDEFEAVMRPIVEQTLRNYFEKKRSGGGAGKAFSGPLIRGDIATTERHLRSLRKHKAALDLYRALINAALESNLPVKDRSAIRKLLRKK